MTGGLKSKGINKMLAIKSRIARDVLKYALHYHELGWSLIPLNRKTRLPVVGWKKYQKKRASLEQIEHWFGENNFGLGVIFGEVSGNLGSIDFDEVEPYMKWKENNKNVANRLPTVKTRRGYHVYFKLTTEQRQAIRDVLGKRGHGAIHYDDGELRMDHGAFSVLPPTIHPGNDKPYEWSKPLVDVPFITDQELKSIVTALTPKPQPEKREPLSPSISNSFVSHSGLDQKIEAAIIDSLPTKFGERNDKILLFARHLKGISELSGMKALQLKPYFKLWHDRALPFIKTKCWRESWKGFKDSFENVKFPIRPETIIKALERAKDYPLPLEAARYDNIKTQTLIALCRQLQLVFVGRAFFLSCRIIEEYVGIPRSTAARRLKTLEADGILRLVKKGTRVTKNASEFLYLGDI